jgi:hypothetical protein
LDGTAIYYFDGQKIIETRDGSGNMVQQFIAPLTRRGPLRGRAALPPMGFAHHAVSRANGTRYIDELVQMRVKDKGNLYVHQGERSERKRAATGKAGEDARVRPATCPEGVSTTRTTGGANWNGIALILDSGRGFASDASHRDSKGRPCVKDGVVEGNVYTPYGEVTVHQGERDQGGSVNAEADIAPDEGVVPQEPGPTITQICQALSNELFPCGN